MSVVASDVLSEVRTCHDEFVYAVRARDAARLVERVYAEEAVVLPPNQPTVWATVGIAEYWRGMFRAGLRDVVLETIRVEVSEDTAFELGRFTLTIQPEDAGEVRTSGPHLAVHCRRPDGSWRLIAEMFDEDALIQ